jgi:two-component system phosphate regulon sensor histidine kinase PhoR
MIGARQLEAGGSVECWVTDSGAGIGEDRLVRIFEKFETDPQNDDGVGLGLAIVKSFVEAHGGTVTAESKLGVGSTFRFTLPSREPRPAPRFQGR